MFVKGWVFMIKFENDFNQENASGCVANRRLKYIITQDRFKFSPELLAEIKNDIINIISNYADVDSYGVVLNFTNENNTSMINASIPLKKT